MPKKKYTVQTPVRHDGKDYAPNDSIELDIPDDHYLLTDGVVADGKAVRSAQSAEAKAKAEAEAKAQAEAEAKAKAEEEVAAAAAAAAAQAGAEGQGD